MYTRGKYLPTPVRKFLRPIVDIFNIRSYRLGGAEAQALWGMRRILQKCRPLVFVEFHDDKGWSGRKELFAADYCLYDLGNARWLDSKLDAQRVYHCLAIPRERLSDYGL